MTLLRADDTRAVTGDHRGVVPFRPEEQEHVSVATGPDRSPEPASLVPAGLGRGVQRNLVIASLLRCPDPADRDGSRRSGSTERP
jgi:hypothetical protein